MDMHLIQHSNKHRVDALEFRIAFFDLPGLHPFSPTELILDEVFPVFELLMRQSRAITGTPDVFPPELRSLERTGLAYCDDLSEMESCDWLCIGVALGSSSYG
jgi:hypothetical protein